MGKTEAASYSFLAIFTGKPTAMNERRTDHGPLVKGGSRKLHAIFGGGFAVGAYGFAETLGELADLYR